MLLPVSNGKFQDLVDKIDEYYREWVKANPEQCTDDNMTTVAGFLLAQNFTAVELSDKGGFIETRKTVASWLKGGRSRAGIKGVSFGRKNLKLARPIKVSGKDVATTTEAYETAGILGFFAACLGVELRYVNDKEPRPALAYTGAEALARERYALPIKRRKVRFDKWGKTTTLGAEKVSSVFDLLAANVSRSTTQNPVGDGDIEFLANIIFSVAIKRTLLCGSVYVDDVAMIRDNLGLTAFGRTQDGVDQPIDAFVLHSKHELKKHPDFIAPAFFVRLDDDKSTGAQVFESYCDTVSLTDPCLIDRVPLFAFQDIPSGLGKEMLALESKAGSFPIDDSSVFYEMWKPDLGYKGLGLNSVTAQFVLAFIRTHSGVATTGSAGLVAPSSWRRYFMRVGLINEMFRNSNTARGVWSDHDPIRGYYTGFNQDPGDPKRLQGTVIVYTAGLDADRNARIDALHGKSLIVRFTKPSAAYEKRITYTQSVQLSVQYAVATRTKRITFTWRDEA